MRRFITTAAVGVVLSLGVLVEPVTAACPADSVQSGTVCMDKYEASVWDLSAVSTSGRTKAKLIASIQAGTVTLASLQNAGAVQKGLAAGDLAADGCPVTGNGCVDVYAVSIPGVAPAAFINWFQAAAAARNSLKRLPTNQEWQVAALGTPDPGALDDGATTCNTNTPGFTPGPTGSRSNCVSDVGAFDMVGNLQEWVAEWVPRDPSSCFPPTGSWGAFSDDFQCLAGAATTGPPGALVRGGSFFSGTKAGVFAVVAGGGPQESAGTVGFRCAR